MEARQYSINGTFARREGIPASFVAKVLVESKKALYVYGHGVIDPQGKCCRCGRTLTHPGSIVLGIGPECLGDWGARDIALDNLTEDDKANMKAIMGRRQIDGWIPKSIVKNETATNELIQVPLNHKMLNKSNGKKEESKRAVLVKYQKSGKSAIKITWPFNSDFKENLTNVKTLPGRIYHRDENPKYWTCPLSIDAVETLQAWCFKLDDPLKEFLAKSKVSIDDMPEDFDIPGLGMGLFPFQKKGVAFIEAKNGRALIADEMGLGKTAQALSWLQLHPELRPAIVVVPASLKLNWKREAKMWMDDPDVQILSGKKTTSPIIGELIIINYDILPAWLGKLQSIKAQTLVIDEIHYVKSNTALRTKAIKALGKNIPHVIGLSGTPIINRPIEAFNVLNIIDDTIFPNHWHYAHRYCAAKHNRFGWDFSGSSNTDELHQKLTQSIMLRRKKEDVLTDLPDKTYSVLEMEIANRQEYRRAEADFIAWVEDTKGRDAAKKAENAEAFAMIEGLKQLTIKGKIKTCIEWIKDFIDIDGKLVVFATHKSTIKILMNEFKDKAVKIDGSVPQKARQEAVDRFQNDNSVRLFVGNIKAAGVGITLTAASNVAFIEFPWGPGDLDQAADRCHRIGQKNAVNIYYLIGQDTIEGKIANLIDSKRKVLDAVLDGKETDEGSLFSELIQSYKS